MKLYNKTIALLAMLILVIFLPANANTSQLEFKTMKYNHTKALQEYNQAIAKSTKVHNHNQPNMMLDFGAECDSLNTELLSKMVQMSGLGIAINSNTPPSRQAAMKSYLSISENNHDGAISELSLNTCRSLDTNTESNINKYYKIELQVLTSIYETLGQPGEHVTPSGTELAGLAHSK